MLWNPGTGIEWIERGKEILQLLGADPSSRQAAPGLLDAPRIAEEHVGDIAR